jgi:hypothetical protein
MESSRIITLFAELPPSRRGPSAFLVSMVLHGLAIGVIYLGLSHGVRVEDASLAQRYTVRLLSQWRPEPPPRRPVELRTARADAQAVRSSGGEIASGGQPAALLIPQQLANLIPAPQTLVQPDLPPNLTLSQEIPIPLLLIWSPENSTAKTILPPPPRETTTANVRPELNAPNHELVVADLRISASAFVTDNPLPLPSTTVPVVVRDLEGEKQDAETTSKPLGPPTPARILSLSDLRLDRGTVALPLINEIAAVGASDAMAPAREVNTSRQGNGNSTSEHNGIGPGEISGNQPDQGAGAEKLTGQSGTTSAVPTGANQAADAGTDTEATVAHIVLPKDGKFGVVVVGSSMAEEYPETVGLWGGRMAYTVYLHVGLAKNWILQYSLPAAADNGSAARIDPPWPYDMERPKLAPGDLNGDAIMVHGLVNASGRFEKIAIVFPADFGQARFVLAALEKWHFRAAMRNGILTTVEVLLIIPAEAAE